LTLCAWLVFLGTQVLPLPCTTNCLFLGKLAWLFHHLDFGMFILAQDIMTLLRERIALLRRMQLQNLDCGLVSKRKIKMPRNDIHESIFMHKIIESNSMLDFASRYFFAS